MADLLELLTAGRRGVGHGPGSGLATVHDSGAERVLVADIADREGVPFAPLSPATEAGWRRCSTPGWRWATRWTSGAPAPTPGSCSAACLSAMADDPAVAAVALAVDLVEEFDGDDSYPRAVLDAAAATDIPVVVLTNLASAVDQAGPTSCGRPACRCSRGRAAGCARSGTCWPWPAPAGRRYRSPSTRSGGSAGWSRLATGRWTRWSRSRCSATTASPPSSCAADDTATAGRRGSRPRRLPGGPQDRRGGGAQVRRGRGPARPPRPGAVASGVRRHVRRLGPRVLVCATAAAGVELSLGLTDDPLLGPVVVLGRWRPGRGARRPRGRPAAAGRPRAAGARPAPAPAAAGRGARRPAATWPPSAPLWSPCAIATELGAPARARRQPARRRPGRRRGRGRPGRRPGRSAGLKIASLDPVKGTPVAELGALVGGGGSSAAARR